jgi:15-cis-phytoene synthase
MTNQPSPTVADAYATCEAITRTAARNFGYGIRLLPPGKRESLSAVYAFARRMDDIGDGDLPAREKLAGLAAARKDVANLSSASSDPVLVALGDTARRFPLPVDALVELIEGVEMDVRGTSYETFDDLVGYCRRVAGTIGRLSVAIFGWSGVTEAEAFALADALGVGLQQTNIMRDVREDLLGGRVYLPAHDLRRFGVTLEIGPDGMLGGPPDSLDALLRAGAARADGWYGRGLGLLATLDRRGAACCGAMAGIYLRLNRRIAADPARVRSERVSLPGWEKAIVAARSLAGRPELPAAAGNSGRAA